jgi:hypothetical protein
MVIVEDFFDAFTFPNMRVRPEAPFRKGLKNLPLGFKCPTSHFAQAIEIGFEGPFCRDFWVELSN